MQVASLHDLVIHPDAQGFGVGTRLLRNMVQHVSQGMGVYDVGLVTPPELQPFFRAAAFDMDREASVALMLTQQRRGGLEAPDAGAAITARVAGNAALAELLRRPGQRQRG